MKQEDYAQNKASTCYHRKFYVHQLEVSFLLSCLGTEKQRYTPPVPYRINTIHDYVHEYYDAVAKGIRTER